ncbi:MAG TPA: T9SS type A sorting domain-containing protein, partial [Flavitalea sp.]|nr:T9SS type A sorting domain-containing protein [Flavitalea sp.]
IKYEWRKQSGPTANITSINSASTTVTGLVPGSYTFVLRIWDNQWEPSEDLVAVTVNTTAPAPQPNGNTPPVSNAGSDISVVLPNSVATLNGTGSYDPDGSINKFEWRKESGPASFTINGVNGASATVTGLVQGTYVFVLRIWDNLWEPSEDKVVVTVGSGIGSTTGAGIGEPGSLITAEQKLTVYPNPASVMIHIRMVNSDKGKVLMNMYDVSGKLVRSRQYQKSQPIFQEEVSVSSLIPGVYMIELITNNQKKSQTKFIRK